jgi:hypothetical protein
VNFLSFLPGNFRRAGDFQKGVGVFQIQADAIDFSWKGRDDEGCFARGEGGRESFVITQNDFLFVAKGVRSLRDDGAVGFTGVADETVKSGFILKGKMIYWSNCCK